MLFQIADLNFVQNDEKPETSVKKPPENEKLENRIWESWVNYHDFIQYMALFVQMLQYFYKFKTYLAVLPGVWYDIGRNIEKEDYTDMKKITKAALSAVLALSMTAPAFAATFSDIGEDKYDWAAPYIEEMAEQGLISGYEDGTYRPDKEVSRLEAICLFARAMGSASEINAGIVELALEKYADVLEPYALNFGQGDVAFMLYRGALLESELDTYLAKDKKNEPMPRYEAAIIITKAMGGEKEAKNELMVDLSYTDAKEIPSKATQYVYYVTEQGIMTGMEDGSFSPETSVLRSQVAVMLSKTVDTMAIGFTEGKILDMDLDSKNITLREADGTEYEMGYTGNTKMILEGDLCQAKDVQAGVKAIFTYAKGELLYVDIVSGIPDETVEGIYYGFSSSSGILTLIVRPDGEEETTEYTCVEGISVIRDGQSSTIRDFEKGDYITMELSNGKVETVLAEKKETKITRATIEEVSIGNELTITISHADEAYDGKTYAVSSDVIVKKNNDTSDMSKIYKGDSVTLVLEYGVVTSLSAESTQKIVEGTIQEIIISSTPKMTALVKGESVTYDIPSGVEILVNGETKTLYDFRVGDSVKLTLEGQAIKKISATAVSVTSKTMTGVVTAMNTSYGFIKISYKIDDTTSAEETVYCKSAKFLSGEGKELLMKNITEGSTVTVRGNVKNGAYEATLVIVETE